MLKDDKYKTLVWTPCLMHKCVCIWWYILQNYNYKLHFQNLFVYHIPHGFIGTLVVESLDVCIACDPWDNNIQLICWVCCWYWYQNLGGAPLRAGHAFLKQRHMCRGGGRLFISAKVFFPVWCHWWTRQMMGRMDGWKKFHKKQPRCPLLYKTY
jgi:hypothetical protein